MEQPKRRLSAVWFADIVGYTELSTRDEPAALRLVDTLQTLAREIIPAFEGRLVKLLGDAVLAEFSSTDSAVRAAVALQERYVAATETIGSQLRVGVHLGEVTATPDGDLYGDGINTASRLQHEAAPGQVIISEDVWRQLRQRPEFRFSSLGAVELRGITSRVEIYDVLFGARAARTPLAAPAAAVQPAAVRIGRPLLLWTGAALLLVAAPVALLFGWLTKTDSNAPVRVDTPPSVTSPPAASTPVPAAPTEPRRSKPEASSPTAPPVTAPPVAAQPGRAQMEPQPGGPMREARALMEKLAAAMMTEKPGPAIEALGPGTAHLAQNGVHAIKRLYGAGLTLRVGRIEPKVIRGDSAELRFYLLAKSATRPETPLPFDAVITRTPSGMQFTSLIRATAGRAGRSRGPSFSDATPARSRGSASASRPAR